MRLVTHSGAMIALAALACAVPAGAASEQRFAVGAPVLGADGKPVGTLEEVRDEAVVVNTGKHLAPITIRSLERLGDTLRINATQDEIDRMMDERRRAEALRRDEYLAPGRLVRSVDSEPVGRIVAIEDAADSVVILRNEGVIALRRDHFAVIEDQLVALFTREQIDRSTKPVPEALRQRLAALSAL